MMGGGGVAIGYLTTKLGGGGYNGKDPRLVVVVVVVQALGINIPIGLQPNVEFNEFQFKFEFSTGVA